MIVEAIKVKLNPLYKYGFTLIEVMIAISILSMGILAVTNMQTTSIRISASSSKLTTALMITQSLAEELMSLKFDDTKLSDLTEEGLFTSYDYDPISETAIISGYEYDSYKGFKLGWEVDNRLDGTKSINVVARWQGIRKEKNLIIPLQRSEQQSVE